MSNKCPDEFKPDECEKSLEVKVCGADCCRHQIKFLFFVSMLLTRQNCVGTFASLPANMKKIESCVLVQTNDNDETLFDAMQHMDNASSNEGVFKSTHHLVYRSEKMKK